MGNSIGTVDLYPVIAPATANHVHQNISADGDSEFVTRYGNPLDNDIEFSGTWNTDHGTTNHRIYIGVSFSTVPNGYDYWFVAPGYRTSPGSKAFSIIIPGDALPTGPQKWYITFRMIERSSTQVGYPATGLNQLTHLSETLYLNRQPDTPNILTPSSGVSLISGTADDLDLTWDFSDPDGVGDLATVQKKDYGGYQIQTRVSPTPSNPEPQWSTPTLHLWTDIAESAPGAGTMGHHGVLRYQNRRGWTTRVDQLSWETDHGVENQHIRILASDTLGVPSATVKSLWLNPGNYQIRVRVFDRTIADGDRAPVTEIPAYYTADPDAVPMTGTSAWSDSISIYVIGNSLPPTLIAPDEDEAVTGDVTFSWMFQSPVAGRIQANWDLFVREVGDTTWNDIRWAGGLNTDTEFTFVNGTAGYTLLPGHHYEWTAYTTDSDVHTSDLAEPARFWYAPAPESGPELLLPEITTPDPGLGCGHNRAFLYQRGGKVMVAEITSITKIVWNRVRDDISSCDIDVNDWDEDCGAMLASIRSWRHEIVVFRNNGAGDKRVWEGPVTRVTYESDAVHIEAKDVMAYVYRRILRQGYNDAYRKIHGVVHGLTSVTSRARKIIQNALAYDDPNVLAYLWVLNRPDDSLQSRVVPDWSRTAWQEVDDLAAKAGLDYTTVGRRIMIWDTHNPVGTLPEMRDGDFDTPPIVTEYGMQMANVYGVTNNNGVWGVATRQPPKYYGYVEMLVSAWGESDDNGTPETLTAEAAAALKETLIGQAERGIAQRWPTPLIVRVPDNSTLSATLSIGINELIPGVHIPLLSNKTLRVVRQTQKLDRVEVTETSDGETVQVTMSPAPTSRDYDPDSDEGVGSDE